MHITPRPKMNGIDSQKQEPGLQSVAIATGTPQSIIARPGA